MKVTKDMLDLARHIVEQRSGDFEPAYFGDRYEAALVDLVNKKHSGERTTAVGEPCDSINVIDLMTALKRDRDGKSEGDARDGTTLRRLTMHRTLDLAGRMRARKGAQFAGSDARPTCYLS